MILCETDHRIVRVKWDIVQISGKDENWLEITAIKVEALPGNISMKVVRLNEEDAKRLVKFINKGPDAINT